MGRVKFGYFFVSILFALTVQPAFAERPLEEASYSEGMNAITEMHVLNSLGLAGELIGIYKALNQASYAAAILHGRKWRPGEDDLSWVDDPDYGKIRHDPFAGLSQKDKEIVKRRLGDIQRFNKMIESGDYANVDEKNNILQGIKEQVEGLKRTLADYPDFYAKAFPNRNIQHGTIGNFSGRWKTEWGIVTINNDGSGSYTHDDGKISDCSVSGGILKGTWSEAPSYKPPKDSGELELKLTEDGNSWNGKYRYGSSGNWKTDWNGERLKLNVVRDPM